MSTRWVAFAGGVSLGILATDEPLATTTIVWYFVAAAVMIGFNAFFVAYEFAIVAARRSSFLGPDQAERRTSAAALAAMSDLSTQLAGAQLGITMTSLIAGFVGEPAFEAVVENILGSSFSPEITRAIGISSALAVIGFIHLVFGEMVPKNLALAAPEGTLRGLVLPYRGYLTVFRPFIRVLNGLANLGCRLVGVEPRDELVTVHSASELAAMIRHSREEGSIEHDDAERLSGALQFAERRVGEVAIPLAEVPTLRIGSTTAQAERIVAASGIERIPIVGSEQDRPLVGYIHARDLLGVDPERRLSPLPLQLIRNMAIVRSDRSLGDVLRTMRRVKRQLAVVVDDGNAVGIISVEDLIGALLAPTTRPEVDANPG
ncbi:MAG: hemolysin family protein [Actinomycetota bacterium]